jgi:hypothetical protein
VQPSSKLARARLTRGREPSFIALVMLARCLALHGFVLYVAKSRHRLRGRFWVKN